MNEEWKDIEGFEGLYQISDFGRVRSYDKTCNNRFHPSRIISLNISTGGYYRFNLNHPITKKTIMFVHQAVAKHFISNKNSYPVINHEDGNKLNCHKDNLKWCTHKYNTNHAFSTGLMKKGAKHRCSKIVIDLNTGVFYDSIRELSTLYNVNENTLYYKLSGSRTNNTNFIFA